MPLAADVSVETRPAKFLGVRPRSGRVEQPRREGGQHPATRAGMLPGEWGSGVTWMELPVQQHAARVHFQLNRGQP